MEIHRMHRDLSNCGEIEFPRGEDAPIFGEKAAHRAFRRFKDWQKTEHFPICAVNAVKW